MSELCDNLTFARYQGDTWIIPFAVTDSNGAEVSMELISEAVFGLFTPDKTEVLRRTLADVIDPIEVSGHVVTVIVPDSETEVTPGQYLFELEIVDADGYRQTIARGTATVVEDLIS